MDFCDKCDEEMGKDGLTESTIKPGVCVVCAANAAVGAVKEL